MINVVDGNTTTSTTLATILKQHTYTLLYFYPKDDTPGCTIEAKEFSQHYEQFLAANIGVYGVSTDKSDSHCSFVSKHSLRIPLISDTDKLLHTQFGTRQEKKMFGKTYMGTIRSTFLLDQSGTVLHQRDKVKAKGHATRVLTWIDTHLSMEK